MRRHFHLAGKTLYYVVGVCLLLLALLTGVLTRAMPWIESHPEQVRAWLSERAGHRVQFTKVDAHWTRRGPLLQLRGLTIGTDTNTLYLGNAELLVSPYTGWMPGRMLTELRLRGIHVNLLRADDGTWSVRGLPGQSAGGDPLTALQRLGELQVVGGRLSVYAPSLGLKLEVPRIDVRTQVTDARVRVGVRGYLQGMTLPTFASMDFQRASGDGSVYVGSHDSELQGYAGLMQFAGMQVAGGHGSGEAWMQLQARRVTELVLRADLRDVMLRSTATAEAPTPVLLQRLQGLGRFASTNEGWRLDLPTLSVTRAGETQTLDGLHMASGEHLSAAVSRIDIPLVTSLATLSDRVPVGLSSWLARAQPTGGLRDVRLSGQGAQQRVEATVDGVGFRAVGHSPGLHNVHGRLAGDMDALALAFDPQQSFTFDWPTGFGVPHAFRPEGTVVFYRDGNGVGVGTDALRLFSPDVSLETRGGLRWQGDGTRPLIGIVATLLSQPQVTASRGYWVHDQMPKQTIDWLNSALMGGTIERAHAIVQGDLDDWPFRNNTGLFEVDATVRNSVLKFDPHWPEFHGDRVNVQFIGPGMHIEGNGSIAGIPVSRAVADIPTLARSELTINADGAADAATMLGLLRQSPLEKDLGNVFAQLDVSGPVRTSLQLFLPFHDHLPYRLDGIATLDGTKLAHREYGLHFDNARGSARYDRHGFTAEGLSVVHEGQPGSLNLRAGGGVKRAANVFEGELVGTLGARELLARVPDLKWMQPHLDGRSRWAVAVDVPKGSAATTVNKVELRSDLVGTRLDLPAPFTKAASVAWPSVITLPLPLGQGEVGVQLGRNANVRARSSGDRTGISIALGGSNAEAPPDSGLVVVGQAATLDASAWLAMLGGTPGAGVAATHSGGLLLRKIDVSADRLLLGPVSFPTTRVRINPVTDGRMVQLQGDGLQGSIHLPNAGTAAVTGRFDRIRWTPPAGAGIPATASAGGSDADIDPATLPPLAFDVADLRIGTAAFNNVVLRTRPVAGGLQLERLDLSAPRQRIGMTGSWTGVGRSAQTRLQARLDTQNFGMLMDGFGTNGQIVDGNGHVALDLRWPGSPMQIDAGSLDGQMHVDIREGKLAKVEPGLGRVLGLFSLAQLPRRLMFDFRDFFDTGFRFNSLSGDIRFVNGKASSNNLAIKGPAADIRIEGAADLAAQQFDQTIRVYPRTSNVLTAVGALTGGPVGAAIGAVAGAILRKPFSQMAAKTYRVTGPWKDPKVQETHEATTTPPP